MPINLTVPAILRQRVEAAYAGDPEQQLLAAGQVVVKDAPEERHCSFGVAVATDALEAVVWSLRKPAGERRGGRQAKRGIGYRLLVGGDACSGSVASAGASVGA
jgi:hypothetical protein